MRQIACTSSMICNNYSIQHFYIVLLH